MQMTALRNPHRTRYVMWMDVEMFLEVTWPMSQSNDIGVTPSADQPRFRLDVPAGASQMSIMFKEVNERDSSLTPKAIFYRSKVWVSGSNFVGRVDFMYRWTQEYLQAYEWLIRNNLTNTDEQVGAQLC
jgi:hypothetical protein